MSVPATPVLLGALILRHADGRLPAGRGRYVSDVVADILHFAFGCSPDPHALMSLIDVEAAGSVPGVVAVSTDVDVAGIVRPARAAADSPGHRPCVSPILPGDRRTVDEPVVIVVAGGRYEAGAPAQVVWGPLTLALALGAVREAVAA